MSAYLKFFELEQSPFEGKAQAQVVLGTKALRDAFALIRGGLGEGDARICVSGGPGLGKTSLARALPKLLSDDAHVAVVLDPDISWASLRGSIAKQWGVAKAGLARAALIEAARDRRLVLVVDQAERASEEFLDHLDVVLSYRSEEDEPVVQSVLFARLSGNEAPEPAPLVWWLDRIQTLQLEFAPLPRDGVESYIHKHMKRAGWQGERLFAKEAALAIHEYTGGIPGEISQLCERLLAKAAELDHRDIDAEFVHTQCDENKQGPEDAEEIEAGVVEDQHEDDAESTEEDAEAEFASEKDGAVSEATDWDGANEGFDFENAALSQPASPEELREVLGGTLGRHGRAFAAAVMAALIGGLAFAWLTGDSPPSEPLTAVHSEQTAPRREAPAKSAARTDSEAVPLVLARLRGPVSPTGEAPAEPEPTTALTSSEPEALKTPVDDLEVALPEDDLPNASPAAPLPSASEEPESGERSW